MKRIIGLVLVFVMVMTLNPVAYSAEITENKSVEVILNNYHARIADVDNGQTDTSAYSLTAIRERNQIKQETFEELASAGYQAYDVNPDTYDSVENALHTDLSELGIDSAGSYIVVVSGDPENNSAVAPAAIVPAPDYGGGGGEFEFTYGGFTYRMREITVTSNDGINYTDADSADLTDYYTDDTIESLLNTTIYTILDSLLDPIPLGTILSAIGIDFFLINTRDYPLTCTLHANATWTRVFTQVWNEPYQEWDNGSSVEYAILNSKYSGSYYSEIAYGYVDIPETRTTRLVRSVNYDNYTWRKVNAVMGYNNFRCLYDMTGDAKFYHGNELKITLRMRGLP